MSNRFDAFSKVNFFDRLLVDQIMQSEFLRLIETLIDEREGAVLSYAHAHTLQRALRDARFAMALQRCNICYADGFGVVAAARVFGHSSLEKVTANDFILSLCRRLVARGSVIGVFGGAPGAGVAVLQGVGIAPSAGRHMVLDGFVPLEEQRRFEDRLVRARPNLVLAALGQPRQELWCDSMCRRLPQTVFLCVGGLVDGIAYGRHKYPRWARRFHLDWLWRLISEPKHTWRRYLLGLPQLGGQLLLRRILEADHCRLVPADLDHRSCAGINLDLAIGITEAGVVRCPRTAGPGGFNAQQLDSSHENRSLV